MPCSVTIPARGPRRRSKGSPLVISLACRAARSRLGPRSVRVRTKLVELVRGFGRCTHGAAAAEPEEPDRRCPAYRHVSRRLRRHPAARRNALPRADSRRRGRASSSGPTASPPGYGPADLQSAYNFNPTGGSGVTVAIVDAFDNPNLESDLQVYRAQYGLPTCSSANGCFTKVNQTGGSKLPKGNEAGAPRNRSTSTWSRRIVRTAKFSSSKAARPPMPISARRWPPRPRSAPRRSATATAAANFKREHEQPVQSEPAGDGLERRRRLRRGLSRASDYTIAVGGTTLNKGGGGSRGWTETVWSGTGSGCVRSRLSPRGRPIKAARTAPSATSRTSPIPTRA
jgi:hypothetical protein